MRHVKSLSYSVQNFQKDKYNIGVIFTLEGVAGLDIAD